MAVVGRSRIGEVIDGRDVVVVVVVVVVEVVVVVRCVVELDKEKERVGESEQLQMGGRRERRKGPQGKLGSSQRVRHGRGRIAAQNLKAWPCELLGTPRVWLHCALRLGSKSKLGLAIQDDDNARGVAVEDGNEEDQDRRSTDSARGHEEKHRLCGRKRSKVGKQQVGSPKDATAREHEHQGTPVDCGRTSDALWRNGAKGTSSDPHPPKRWPCRVSRGRHWLQGPAAARPLSFCSLFQRT